MPTTQNLLTEALSSLTGPETRQEAEWLMEAICGITRTRQFSHPHDELSTSHALRFREALQRRLSGEPLAYIIGYRDFWDMRLAITPDVLIPQPDTEVLVEQALKRIPATAEWVIADLGAGSGAVALVLARERPSCHVLATDVSASALKVAAGNRADYKAMNVQLVQTSWLQSVAPGSLDMIVSNPPYIAENDDCLVSGDVSREPRLALSAGPEGLDELNCIIRDSVSSLKTGGWLLVEHGFQQARDVAGLFSQSGYLDIFTIKDFAGNERVTGGRL
ncbi:MAG TPA: peptide chain release factor N(5)-glutamine methyltransferase [Gammaproteobacteria bacterium]|nr:peptide chain release factor N(5)-glutamine methyltransferase [Gammaproteobacteria bacterium]